MEEIRRNHHHHEYDITFQLTIQFAKKIFFKMSTIPSALQLVIPTPTKSLFMV